MKSADAAYLEAEYGKVAADAWPPRPPRYSRRPWLAALLSVVVPGLGHVYVGEMRRGLRLWSALIALFVLSGWVGVWDRFWGLAVVLVAGLALYAYVIRDAALHRPSADRARLRQAPLRLLERLLRLVASRPLADRRDDRVTPSRPGRRECLVGAVLVEL